MIKLLETSLVGSPLVDGSPWEANRFTVWHGLNRTQWQNALFPTIYFSSRGKMNRNSLGVK